ncbi:MAG: hypothetical protein METHP_00538 [Methanoregula sp. SKADARSKE-2]|nr:MAG: hypothetical protein METHP_00538 [Methanoregula sp. SKADARSKE-2]
MRHARLTGSKNFFFRFPVRTIEPILSPWYVAGPIHFARATKSFYNTRSIAALMPKIKIRPADMAKIHKTHPLGEYGPCEFAYCSCPEFFPGEISDIICNNCGHDRRYHAKR